MSMSFEELDRRKAKDGSTGGHRAHRSGRRRSWPVLTVFICIVTVQLLVAVISIDVMSAVRAYVTGESLYSKGQKDAHINLVEYAEHFRDEDYQKFLSALAMPIGDRVAREALLRSPPDKEEARRGLLAGGTQDDEIPGVIRLFLGFHKTPLMADAIATWTEGDQLIERVRQLGAKAHARVLAGDLQAPEVTSLRENAQALNDQLTQLEVLFASQLAEGARRVQNLLLGLNLGLALLLGVSGLAFVRHSYRIQAATEDEVRHRQQSLQRLLDSAAEGLYGVDTQGRCTFINRAALRMLGYARESELVGQDMHALIQHSHADGAPRPAHESAITRSYREQSELHVTDEVFWRRDGTSFPVEYWSHPMMMDDQVQGAVATFFDITERVHMQQALRRGEVRIAGLVDAVNDGVVTIDSDERIVLFNRAAERLFGVRSGDAIGRPVGRFIQDLPGGNDASDWQGGVRDLTGRRANGDAFPLEASLSRVDSDRGTLVTAVLRDVTDLHLARAERQAREALEASNRAKTEFLSRMSHELRTPLNAVLGFAQLLRLDTSQKTSLQQLERIQHIENAGAHLLALVNDVLDLSRVESGHLTVSMEAVDVRSAIEDAMSMVVPLASAGDVALAIAGADEGFAGHELSVLADRVRLRQVLVNLLSNAVKYNRQGGEVKLRWEARGKHCAMSVTDNGLGMSPDKLSRLFEPFNRLGAENSKVEGTGIGLVLSRRLAESMGGELHIDSSPHGTVAWLTLPRSIEAVEQPDGFAAPSQHGALELPLTVLYAEDNEVNVELVRHIAKLRPSIVLDVAENGATALHKARCDPPDLMLLDMSLGDMSGMQVAQALRADAHTAGIRLVALSADALPEQIGAAMAAGFEDYLTKPIDFRELLDVFDGKRPARSGGMPVGDGWREIATTAP
jgi:PAS domain S-box-containing protein